ncbi:MAG TPA: M23 family metallopeptidase [Methylobacterium sp.]|jgi:murein DD-endopeptidase MepM/ murein hydrolase activator NlpD|uniref:M23 family metallopeptidase n=1 Tax=Methylorubrum sp. B1-46 TaxID=2897334 RepID=UPI001E5C949E|nr:M23 family metallopeptidase [Methylorubrum sp. B1-46]UGB24240.1 M23 family metallopeptidase [Methylorubrum sp. B1-46]HEV2545623.1 M23 family metallopeptidase [Methylobacterium sp.]
MTSTAWARRSAGLSSPPPRRLIVALSLGLAVSTLWAAGASYYLVFHDEVLARFVSRQSAMQFTYEERLGTLQRALDRSAAESVAARGSVENRLATLIERQALIEKRQGLLSGFAGAASIDNPPPAPAPAPAPVADTAPRVRKPFPTPGLRMGGEDRVEIIGHDSAARLSRLEDALQRVAEAQSRTVAGMARQAARSAERFRDLIARTGLSPARFDAPPAGVGGPLVPLGTDTFESALADARRQIDEETHLRRVAAALPFRQPLPGELTFTSSFGARLDPFTRGYALHTGVDMRIETGTPVQATAAGRVTASEYAGGYGNMVEVDHGRGLVTRYAHLSGTAVSVGQRVEAGTVVGFAGSTGRSTGSHLHYETRIDGEPVDPQRFLRAGAQLVFAD